MRRRLGKGEQWLMDLGAFVDGKEKEQQDASNSLFSFVPALRCVFVSR